MGDIILPFAGVSPLRATPCRISVAESRKSSADCRPTSLVSELSNRWGTRQNSHEFCYIKMLHGVAPKGVRREGFQNGGFPGIKVPTLEASATWRTLPASAMPVFPLKYPSRRGLNGRARFVFDSPSAPIQGSLNFRFTRTQGVALGWPSAPRWG